MKIKRLIMTLLIVLSLTPTLLVSTTLIVANKSNIDKVTGQDLEAVGSAIIMNIQNYCSRQQTMLTRIAESKLVEDVLVNRVVVDSSVVEYMDNLLLECKNDDKNVVSIAIVDMNFQIIGATGYIDPYEQAELTGMETVLKKKDIYFGNSYHRKSGEGNRQVMFICVPIERGEERIGYVIEEISTEFFDELREETKLAKNDLLAIVDGDERAITSGYVGREGTSSKALDVLKCESYRDKWNKINHYISTSGTVRFRNGLTKYSTYYAVVDGTEWMLRLTVDLNRRYAGLLSYMIVLVISLICVGVILLYVNYILTRKITQPIDSISSTLDEVQKRNDYSLRIYVDKKGDLGEVSEQINQLLEYVETESKQDKQIQKQLEKNVELDPLTGILNKKAIHEDLEVLVERANELDIEIAVGFVDVDNFRDFNTKYGHQVGDEVLKNVAKCLKKAIPGVVGRNGGDEFLFCMLIRRRDDNLDYVLKDFYKNLRKGVSCDPYGVLAVTCSVGVAHVKGGSLNVSQLEKIADEAMYVAKNQGKNNYHIKKEE